MVGITLPYRSLHFFQKESYWRAGSVSDRPSVFLDSAGNLYGVSAGGGVYAEGALWKVTPEGQETTIYSWCSGGFPCADGSSPGGLIPDGRGGYYGAATTGGDNPNCTPDQYPPGGCGVIFRITKSGEETVLYSFGGADGAGPVGLALDVAGNIYGATGSGGNCPIIGGCGTIFKLTPKGELTTLYAFQASTDGLSPNGVSIDKNGRLYGTTELAGAGQSFGYSGVPGCGVVFKVVP
jgi:uncharacterized repeat protein (TIGR03803 family)